MGEDADVVFIDFTPKYALLDATRSKIKQTYPVDSSSYFNKASTLINVDLDTKKIDMRRRIIRNQY